MDRLCRMCMRHAVLAVLSAHGFASGEERAVDVLAGLLRAQLSEMISFLTTTIDTSNRTTANIRDAQLMLDTFQVTADDLFMLYTILKRLNYPINADQLQMPTKEDINIGTEDGFRINVPFLDKSDVLPLPLHIPPHLPAFPPVHAYKRTKICSLYASQSTLYPLAAEQSSLVDTTLRRLMMQHSELFSDVPGPVRDTLARTVTLDQDGEVDKWWRRKAGNPANGLRHVQRLYGGTNMNDAEMQDLPNFKVKLTLSAPYEKTPVSNSSWTRATKFMSVVLPRRSISSTSIVDTSNPPSPSVILPPANSTINDTRDAEGLIGLNNIQTTPPTNELQKVPNTILRDIDMPVDDAIGCQMPISNYNTSLIITENLSSAISAIKNNET